MTDSIKKRTGEIVPFDGAKIIDAVTSAMNDVRPGEEEGLPEKILGKVTERLDSLSGIPGVELIQDMVIEALKEEACEDIAAGYAAYREDRAKARNSIRVRSHSKDKRNLTDQSMLVVKSLSEDSVNGWDRSRIVRHLADELGLELKEARSIAKLVEKRIIKLGMTVVDSGLVRELTNGALAEKGHAARLQDVRSYTVSKEFVRGLMGDKINENSNVVSNTPESVSMTVSDIILKQFALDNVFSEEVRNAHNTGAVYVHDLGFPHRLYCSSHSLEYLKKYGLVGLVNLNSTSKPAKTASVLTGHLNTFLASMQAYYAGALGLGFVNVLYAPLLRGLSEKELKQVAQELVFNGSQNAFSRGSQTIFTDINLLSGVPVYMKDVPAIGPGGKYMFERNDGVVEDLVEFTDENGDVCLKRSNGTIVLRNQKDMPVEVSSADGHVLMYGHYQEETQAFAHALLDVWAEGDASGHIFEFPKCDFHVSAETFTDDSQYRVYLHACEVAAHNGSTYFIFDRDTVSLASCCRLRVQITDESLVKHPERLRTVGFQNVTINIPQAAYRAARKGNATIEGLLEEIDAAMDIAVKAHLQKKKFSESIMTNPTGPLWQLGKVANDGRPYVDLKDATYIIGIIGVNDAVKYLTGQELHESDEAINNGLRIVGHMYLKTKQFTKDYGLSFKLEESPAESAARKLAKADLHFFRDEALSVYKGGDEDHAYYTNSIHLAADAPVDLLERIRQQSMFNSVIEAGAITHAFIGEEHPSADAIASLVQKVFLNTQCAQLTFSPEFTYCNSCGHTHRGLTDECSECGSEDVFGETRIVGYFSRISNFNLSKLAELRARQRGKYKVQQAFEK